MTTESQILANSTNALKSTGPKNTSKTCFNAIKHGILAKEIGIKRIWINENPKEFRQILEFLIEDIKPTSVIENILTERIAVAYWKLRRVTAAEHGLIKRAVVNPRNFEEIMEDARSGESFNEYLTNQLEKMKQLPEEQQDKAEIGNIRKIIDFNEIAAEIKLETKKAINSIPPFEHLDVLSRYETTLERQFYRAINQLEKMRQKPLESKLLDLKPS